MRTWFFLLCMGFPVILFSQKNKAGIIWLTEYGNAIDFKPTPPTLLAGNKITYGIGRISTMSDENGNLLFYTSGDTVWNRHQYDIGVRSIAEVAQSGIEIGKRKFSEQFGDLQLAYDGKIYTGLSIGQTTEYLSFRQS